jgi:hypothetical protein
MGKVILDAETRAKLNGLAEQLELYDESGNLIGYYLPPKVYSALRMPVDPPFTEEEIEEAFNQTGPGRPLADILADLRKR